VAAIEIAGVGVLPPAHFSSDIRLGCVNDQVVVVRREDAGADLPTGSPAANAESKQEPAIIAIIKKNALPAISPRHHLVGAAVVFDPKLER